MKLQLAIRIGAGITLALLLAGGFYFFGTSIFMCFDVCPSPADLPQVALRQAAIAFGAGLLLAFVTWVLYLVALARAGMQRGLVIAAGLPVILGGALVLTLAYVPPAAVLPATEAEYGAWSSKVLLASLVTLVLVLIMLILAPASGRRGGASGA